MISVSRLSLHEILLPLREPFTISSGVTTTRRILLLELREASGITAWAECVAGDLPNYSPETIDTAWLAIREWLAPRLLKARLSSPEDAHELLSQDIRGHEMARAALEMGVWALFAEARGSSLTELIGGQRKLVATGISLGIQPDPEALVERARAALEQGYRKIKIKIKPGKDLEWPTASSTSRMATRSRPPTPGSSFRSSGEVGESCRPATRSAASTPPRAASAQPAATIPTTPPAAS
jgi:O-succinylbenzoate synthase